jgi:ferric-dicitrate binding protein FerR (iron transport regulator)
MNDFDRDTDREAALRVLAPMREGPLAVAGRAEQEAALRARVVHSLQAQVGGLPLALDARRRQRRLIALASSGAVLAAAAAAALAWLPQLGEQSAIIASGSASAVRVEAIDIAQGHEQAPATWIDAAGKTHPLVIGGADSELPSGTLELRANGTTPRLRTAQGAKVKLSPRGRLRVTSARAEEGPALRLLEGEVACVVPKLGATRQFAIDAPGARVIVHGTQFSVRAEGGMTCVRVTEGVVAVHPESSDAEVERLGPGDSWGCEPETDVGKARRTRAAKRGRVARAIEREEPVEAEPAPAGTLDEENRLLAEALRAERKQDRARAHRLFSELLRKHPASLLAVEAEAGLSRTRQ